MIASLLAVSGPSTVHAGLLTRGKLLIANTTITISNCVNQRFGNNLLVGVIHKVVDGVVASLVRAAIPSSRASTGLASLSRGIADQISTSAAILESMEEVEPMTDLVNGSSTEVIRSH